MSTDTALDVYRDSDYYGWADISGAIARFGELAQFAGTPGQAAEWRCLERALSAYRDARWNA